MGVGVVPGSGGVNRGRGDADLSFGDETDSSGMRFKNRAYSPGDGLLPGATLDRKHMRVDKINATDARAVKRSGILLGNTGGGKTAGGRLGPRNRAVATRYFKEAEGDE